MSRRRTVGLRRKRRVGADMIFRLETFKNEDRRTIFLLCSRYSFEATSLQLLYAAFNNNRNEIMKFILTVSTIIS